MSSPRYATYSGSKVADGVITSQSCLLHGVVVSGATTAPILYDNASAASGSVVFESTGSIAFHTPISCNNGLYLDWTDGKVIVYYSLS